MRFHGCAQTLAYLCLCVLLSYFFFFFFLFFFRLEKVSRKNSRGNMPSDAIERVRKQFRSETKYADLSYIINAAP
jgi:hypothetical protein